MNIVWGYNGTIIPFMPYSAFYSSDHILIDYLRTNNYLPFKKKLMASFMLKHEKSSAVQSWTRGNLGSLVAGQPSIILENISKILSAKISEPALEVMRKLQAEGFEQFVASCSTDSLIKGSLYHRGADTLFRGIVGNHISSYSGQIMDYTCNFRKGEDKVEFLEQTMRLSPENTIVIGASRDDIPLLEWSRYPILVDASRDGWKEYEDKHFIFMESVQMVPEIIKSLI